MGPTEYKVAARSFARHGGLPSVRLLFRCTHTTDGGPQILHNHRHQRSYRDDTGAINRPDYPQPAAVLDAVKARPLRAECMSTSLQRPTLTPSAPAGRIISDLLT